MRNEAGVQSYERSRCTSERQSGKAMTLCNLSVPSGSTKMMLTTTIAQESSDTTCANALTAYLPQKLSRAKCFRTVAACVASRQPPSVLIEASTNLTAPTSHSFAYPFRLHRSTMRMLGRITSGIQTLYPDICFHSRHLNRGVPGTMPRAP